MQVTNVHVFVAPSSPSSPRLTEITPTPSLTQGI